jgi:hypothetical protein
MTLLRILRNLAVLVILTVGWLSLSPRAVAALSTCHHVGALCTSNAQCCFFSTCDRHHICCSLFHGAYCTSPAQCCSNTCIKGRCY